MKKNKRAIQAEPSDNLPNMVFDLDFIGRFIIIFCVVPNLVNLESSACSSHARFSFGLWAGQVTLDA